MRVASFIIGFIVAAQTLCLGQYVSPFNQKEVVTDSTGDYSFTVSGHFHGQSSNTTGYPVNTLLAHLDWINDEGGVMLVSLGDLFLDVTNDIPNYEESLFKDLEIPLVNAVGNHDLTDNIYQDHFGETNFYFELGNDLHIVFDTEMNDGDLDEDQLDFLLKATENNYDNVFIYTHRTIWKGMYAEMDGIFEDNTQSILTNNFESEVYPLIEKIAKKSSVFWFSGSLGEAPASFFYHEDANVTYIATAIRGLKRDAMLQVSVNDGQVNFTTHSLTGQDLAPLPTYNVQFWQDNVGRKPFNWRLLPLHIKNTLLSWSFWWGVLFGALTFVFIRWIIKKIRSRLNHS
ncbi:MAG: hypothetical protein H6582_04635 [Crocinitomicaceae bacterium]|nr:hypothetical protein [Crocinitomicaceae bacterium]